MRVPSKEEVNETLDFIEKVVIRLVSLVGWIKILIDAFK